MARLLNHGGPVALAGRKLDGRRAHKPSEGFLPDELLDHPMIKAMLADGRLEHLDAPPAEPEAKPEPAPKPKRKRGRKSKPRPEAPAPAPEPEPESQPDLEPMDPAEE